MNYRKGMIAALLAPMITLGGGALSSLHAAGYAVFTQGAAALGQGNAVTAHTQSPSTIFYNPALMNKLEGTQVEVGTTALIVSRKFDSDPGGHSTSNDSSFFPSTFYATYKYNDKLSAGLGVFNPFGLGTEWNGDWDGRFMATKSTLTTFDVNPVVSYRVTPALAVAVGLDVMLVDATLERKIFTGGPDANQKFKGDGSGIGYNVGVAYDLNKDITMGVSYRSAVHVNVAGSSSTSPTFQVPITSVVSPRQAALFPPGTLVAPLDSTGRTSIRLPQQVTAGIAYHVIAPLTVEAGLRWEGWSAFKELQLTLDNGFSATTQRNWHDSWGANLGARYQFNDTFALLAGYVYGESAVPDSTFDPSIPDAATHVFCLGTDLNYRSFKLSLSYAYQLYEDRAKQDNLANPALPPVPGLTPAANANGTYQSDAHLIAVSLGYKF
jgi:long-chain fatty acid transport protein